MCFYDFPDVLHSHVTLHMCSCHHVATRVHEYDLNMIPPLYVTFTHWRKETATVGPCFHSL